MVMMESAQRGMTGLARLERSDGEALRRFFYRLSPQTVYRRFLSPIVRPDQLAHQRLLEVDGSTRQAVVAVQDGEIIGVARYTIDAGRPSVAELAVVVADAWQGHGIATRLLAALAELARAAGVEQFSVVTQGDNRAALGLVRLLSPEAHLVFAGGGLYEGSVPLRAA